MSEPTAAGPREQVTEAAQAVAAAIARRDLAALQGWLADGFVFRAHAQPPIQADAFLQAIGQIPGTIRFIRLEQLEVDLAPHGALVTGIQHAAVDLAGTVINDRKGFVDWFIFEDGRWRLRAAVELPAPPG